MSDFLDQLDSLIDRPCQWTDCGRMVPESSPSRDFCSEVCERSWRAANVGGKFVPAMWAGYSLGETEVPEDHPAAPTHHGSEPPIDDVWGNPGVGIMQIMSAAERRPFEARRSDPAEWAAQVRRIAELYAVPPSMLLGPEDGRPTLDWEAIRRELGQDARPDGQLFDPLCAPLSVTVLIGFLVDRVVTSPNMPDSVLVALPSGRDGETMVMRMWHVGSGHVHSACSTVPSSAISTPSSPNLEHVRVELARYFRVPLEQVWMRDLDRRTFTQRLREQSNRLLRRSLGS